MWGLVAFGSVVLLIIGVVFSAKKWGGAKVEKDHLENIVKDVVEKKEIDHEVNRLNEDDLLSRWLKFVRKQ